MTDTAQAAALTCDVCGKSFATTNALGAHRNLAHKLVGNSNGVDEQLLLSVEEQLATAARGLVEQLDEIETTINGVQRQLDTLKSNRTYLLQAVRRIDPSYERRPYKKRIEADRFNGAKNPAKIARIEQFVTERGSQLFPDGFTTTDIWQTLRDEDPPDLPQRNRIGKDVVKDMLRDMHDRSLIRVDRKMRGGHLVYKVTGRSN